ncbi:MAG: AAA family ATPase [Candidatus Lokiarchaeota archaeon]|nr:AAA family ATPase [Candidatus Lokiarchaeota archaeon]
MIITKVELENIATHKSTVIDFQDGLNVLLGQNGTGKSTVLNMIGFNLFDFLQGNQRSYIREDALNRTNYGNVKVWIVGLNDDQYIINRTIGKQANIIEVSDAKTGTLLPGINDKSSLQQWLKTQIGLKREFNLSKIFNTSVGVPQGTFTEPFLRSPQGRKDFFDPILQVEVYRSMWTKIKGIQNSFLEDIHQFEKDAQNIKGFLENKDELLEKADNTKANLDRLKEKEIELKIQLKKVTETHDLLSKLKLDLEINIQSIKELERDKSELILRIKEKNEDLGEAMESNNICHKTKKDYEKYEQLSRELNKLSSIIEIESNIESKIQEINKIKSSTKDLERFTKDYHKDIELQRKIEEQQELISKFHNYREHHEETRDKYTSLTKKIDAQEKTLTNLSKIETQLTDLEKIFESQRILENQIIVLETQLNQLEINKEYSENGNCPILNEKCQNIQGRSLEQIFEKKIKEWKNNLDPKKKEFQDNEKKLVDFENIKKEYDDLRESSLEMEIFKKQKLELGRDIQKIKNNMKDESIEEQKLTSMKKSKIALEENVRHYHILRDKFEKSLPTLSEELIDLQNKKHTLVNGLGLTKKGKDSSINLSTTFDSITEEMTEIQENHDKFQLNEKLAKRLPNLKIEVEDYEKNLKKTDDKLKIEIENKDNIEKVFVIEEYNNIIKEKEEINESYIKVKESINNESEKIEEFSQQIDVILEKEKELVKINDKLESLEFLEKFIDTIRTWYKEASPKITETLLNRINTIASDIYRDLIDIENVQLSWENDYNVKIKTNTSEREYRQLSGGEQMAAALAVRLAILKILTNADFAFFDEPTTNLDKDKRNNLAKCIQNIKGFRQIFVISHDDTFEENAENIIRFTKDDDEITHVQFLSN